MERTASTRAAMALPVVLLVGAAIGWAGAQGGRQVGAGLSVFALCGALCFAINWLAFVPAFVAQTERWYDFTGTLTTLAAVGCALILGNQDPRSWLLATLCAVWTLRLGSFLFSRIEREGGDGRFDALKPDFARFLLAWTLQGLWVFVTAACALAAMTTATPTPLGALAGVGALVWAVGFAIEAVADLQKQRFRADPGNRGRFIASGLWAWSRHPNYCGEIILWGGMALIAAEALRGPALWTLVSPLFVYLLLSRISGVPLLEARADSKWGDDPDYLAYKARTPVLWLRPPAAPEAQDTPAR